MDMEAELDHKVVRLHRAGGSRTLTLPLQWLRRIGVPDDLSSVRLHLQKGRIVVEPAEPPTIEDDPAFPVFLDFILQDAMRHPETLTNAADVLAEDEDLVPRSR